MINLQKQSHSWLKKGNPNVQHHAALLDAEMAALKKKRSMQGRTMKEPSTWRPAGG
jgi:hypothetical protein